MLEDTDTEEMVEIVFSYFSRIYMINCFLRLHPNEQEKQNDLHKPFHDQI